MLTTAEAAARLGLTVRSVARLIRSKQLAATWNEYARRFEVDPAEVERYTNERRSPGRPRKERPMLAVEIKLNDGTFYIPLNTFDGGSVLVPMDGGERVLTPGDIRANWNAWVSDEVSDDMLLTADELAEQHPGIAIDREP